jgi:hypothetical protein
MESADVSYKDAAAKNWYQNASAVTGMSWRYLKVPQQPFELL